MRDSAKEPVLLGIGSSRASAARAQRLLTKLPKFSGMVAVQQCIPDAVAIRGKRSLRGDRVAAFEAIHPRPPCRSIRLVDRQMEFPPRHVTPRLSRAGILGQRVASGL